VRILFDVRSAKIQYIIHVNVRERNTQISINLHGGVLGGRGKYAYICEYRTSCRPTRLGYIAENRYGKKIGSAIHARVIIALGFNLIESVSAE